MVVSVLSGAAEAFGEKPATPLEERALTTAYAGALYENSAHLSMTQIALFTSLAFVTPRVLSHLEKRKKQNQGATPEELNARLDAAANAAKPPPAPPRSDARPSDAHAA